jgi:MFS family permease
MDSSAPRSARRFTRGFQALTVPNFRLFFLSQAVSVSGNWMQTTALGWLVVQLTGDGIALGTTMALQYAPLLILGPLGGSIVDRMNVRHVVIASQVFAGILALSLFALAALGLASMPAIYLISLLMGFNGVVDNPGRRALISELVPPGMLGSAVSLTGVLVNTSRVIGPAIAAGVIAIGGTTPCFLLNGISYGAMVAALALIRTDQLIPGPARGPGPIKVADTLRYVAGVPILRRALLSMTIVATFTLEMPVVLPLLASGTFGGDGSTYGILLAVLSVGGVLGAVFSGAIGDTSMRRLEASLIAFGLAMTGAALAPTLALEFVALMLTGFFAFAYITLVSTSVQVNVTPEHRGRVLALWSMAFLGTTMIGAPIIGWISNVWGPRAGLLAGAAACLVAAVVAFSSRERGTRREPDMQRGDSRPPAPVATSGIEPSPEP